MSIQFVENLETETVWNKLQDRINKQDSSYAIWKKVESILSKMDGQKITKRIQTAIEKEFSEALVSYDNNYGMFHIYLWGKSINREYDNRMQFLIGYADSPYIDFKKIQDHNTCWELEKSRSEKMRMITRDDIVKQVEKWNNAINDLKAVYDWGKPYEINYMSIGFDLNIR